MGASVPARAAKRRGLAFHQGVAITGSFHPDARTHIEPVRYGAGANALGLLQSALVAGGPARPLRWLGALLRAPHLIAHRWWVRRWSQRTVIALVMQSLDNSVTLRWRRAWYGRRRLFAEPGTGEPNPTWIPAGHRAARLLAEEIGGYPAGAVTEAFNAAHRPHPGRGGDRGRPHPRVVDPYHRVFGHPGLHVLDARRSAPTSGQPGADHHRAGGAGDGALAPPGEPDPGPRWARPYRRVDPAPPRCRRARGWGSAPRRAPA